MKKGVRMFSEEEFIPRTKRKKKRKTKKADHKHEYRYEIQNDKKFWGERIFKTCKICGRKEVVCYFLCDKW